MVKVNRRYGKKKGIWEILIGGIRRDMSLGARLVPEVMETVQDSVPVYCVHEGRNLIETGPGLFTRMYAVENINYRTASEQEQESILTKYRAFLNSLGSNTEMALTLFNRNINLSQFQEEALLKETGDGFDHLRHEMNKVIMARIMEGKNGITRDEYITLGVRTEDAKKAGEVFKRLDNDMDRHFKMMQSSARPLKIEERLEILHDIYNPDNAGEFLIKTRVFEADTNRLTEVTSFDFENIRSMGISVKDVLAPSSMVIRPKHMELGNHLVRVLRVTELPAALSDTFLSDLTNMPFNMITTFHVRPMSNAETNTLINRQLAFIREEKHNLQRSNQRNQIDESMINPEVLEREEDVLKLRREIRENDEHLFETTLTVVIFAQDMSLLEEYTESVISECKKASVTCEILTDEQEEGFDTTLPLCCNLLHNKRTLKSSSCAVFVPFSNLEVKERDGINYSMNAASKNLLIYNRENKANYNGFILGSSGSGKSFTAKTEIINVFLKKSADILILDPEQEYVYMTTALGGQVIPVMPGGRYHINPLDISAMDYEFDESSLMYGDAYSVDPILEKVSFITKLFESMLQKTFGMDSIQKALIDECLRTLYAPFMQDNRLFRCPRPEETPTFNDMMDFFAASREPEARELFFTLKRYAGEGTLNIFAQRTNVELHNRIVCFDISSVGDELKLLAMNIIQDAMWSRLVENRRIGRFTYIYVDECHLFFQAGNDSAAEFLTALWKRARKYGGVPTGITQNTSDMVDHPLAKKLLSECNFIQVLNQQSDEAREHLRGILNLSDSMMDYIISAPPGQGLFYTGSNVVPFYSHFPEDNAIYPYLTSDMKKLAEYRERERRERLRQKQEERKKNML